MKIACIGMMDNGNFLRHAARGLRDYCGCTAMAWIQNPDTYVNIPDDTVIRWHPHGQQGRDINEYPDADFYLLNDHTYFHHYRFFKDKPRLVKCNGTFARDQGGWFQWDYVKHNTHYLSSPCDYTLARALPFTIQSIPPLIDVRLFPAPNFGETIRVGHAPTNPYKGTKAILEALHPYKRKGMIEVDLITQTPWTDAIQRKAQCHIFIDQAPPDVPHPGVSRGAFGINAVEALALGSLVLNEPLHPYVLHHYDGGIPLFQFPESLSYLLTSLQDPTHTIEPAPDWARDHFDISTQVPRIKDWIDYLCSNAY